MNAERKKAYKHFEGQISEVHKQAAAAKLEAIELKKQYIEEKAKCEKLATELEITYINL